MKQETEVHFLVGTVILGFLSILKKSKASSPFEALNYVCLSRCQSDVIPPVQMRQRPTTFSRVSTGDSDMPSSCEMKVEPEFKPNLQVDSLPTRVPPKTWFYMRLRNEASLLDKACWLPPGSKSPMLCWGKGIILDLGNALYLFQILLTKHVINQGPSSRSWQST